MQPACRARLRQHRARRPGRHRRQGLPGARRAHRSLLGLRRDDPRPGDQRRPPRRRQRRRQRRRDADAAAVAAEAERQWVATFARDRADLGPAHAAEQAAREAANYATTRPLPVVIAELRTAWTAEQDALDQLERAEPRAAKLREIITAHATEERELVDLQRAAREARGAAIDADTRLQQTTADGRTATPTGSGRRCCATGTPNAPPPAPPPGPSPPGPGRLGQHRGRVADARQQLADWSRSGSPTCPPCPPSPHEVARFAGWWDNRPAHADAFDRYAHHRAAELHPEHDAATAAADAARTRAREAETACRDASQRHSLFQWRYGSLAHLPDPAAALADTERDIEPRPHPPRPRPRAAREAALRPGRPHRRTRPAHHRTRPLATRPRRHPTPQHRPEPTPHARAADTRGRARTTATARRPATPPTSSTNHPAPASACRPTGGRCRPRDSASAARKFAAAVPFGPSTCTYT